MYLSLPEIGYNCKCQLEYVICQPTAIQIETSELNLYDKQLFSNNVANLLKTS